MPITQNQRVRMISSASSASCDDPTVVLNERSTHSRLGVRHKLHN